MFSLTHTVSLFRFFNYKQAFVSRSLAPKEFLELENACVKACNNDLSAPKEKHVQTLLLACGGGQGNSPDRVSVADINYVLNSITKVIGKATGWISMLKAHVVLHRLFQECGGKFQKEFFHHVESLRNARSGGKEQDLFSLRYWKDDSSQTAFELSGWVRAYALYFEEYTCCAKVWPFLCSQGSGSTPMQSYNFDQLLQHVPVAQTLMHRLTDCEPVGEVLRRNDVPVRAATALMFKDSLKVFKLANEGVCALVGLFFEQDKAKARKGLEIYKRSLIQHEDLQRFYATCQKMQIVNQAPALEAPPQSFLGTMQEYVDTAKAGEMPAGVGARRSSRTSVGGVPSQSSPGAAASAGTTAQQQSANATLDALFGEMNIQTPPQNARENALSNVAVGNFLPASGSSNANNDDPFGLATITASGNAARGQQQPAASTSASPVRVPPPVQQQQQQPRNGSSNNPFGDDLFGTPKKAVAAPVDLNSLYDQANTRQQQQQQQQPQYGGGMMPPQMMGGGNPGYYQQQASPQQQYGGVGVGVGTYPPQHQQQMINNNMMMGYHPQQQQPMPMPMGGGAQYHPQQQQQQQQQQMMRSPQQSAYNPQQQQQQQQQRQQPSSNANNNNNFLL